MLIFLIVNKFEFPAEMSVVTKFKFLDYSDIIIKKLSGAIDAKYH